MKTKQQQPSAVTTVRRKYPNAPESEWSLATRQNDNHSPGP